MPSPTKKRNRFADRLRQWPPLPAEAPTRCCREASGQEGVTAELVAAIAAVTGTLAALITVFFAWRALVATGKTLGVARETLEDARREREILRLERVRVMVGELERLHRWGGDTRRREQTQDELATLLPSLGSYRRLPKTMALAHWNSKLENAEDLLDEARLEVDAAIEKRLRGDYPI
jgi:hypothetical protein